MMMKRIKMSYVAMSRWSLELDNSELGRTVTTGKKTTGVSALDGMARCARNIFAFDPFFKGWGSKHSNIFHSVSLRKVEDIFPLVVVVALVQSLYNLVDLVYSWRNIGIADCQIIHEMKSVR